jgi:hypothetical protein
LSDLLKKLPAAEDDQEFESILGDIFSRDTEPDPHDRVKARREVSKYEWYDRIRAQFGDILYGERLAAIFRIIVIPDLDQSDVVKKITDWAGRAQPAVIGSLLAAAKHSGDPSWQLMVQILQPKLAHRWTVEHHMEGLWDPEGAPSGNDPGRNRFNFWKKN